MPPASFHLPAKEQTATPATMMASETAVRTPWMTRSPQGAEPAGGPPYPPLPPRPG